MASEQKSKLLSIAIMAMFVIGGVAAYAGATNTISLSAEAPTAADKDGVITNGTDEGVVDGDGIVDGIGDGAGDGTGDGAGDDVDEIAEYIPDDVSEPEYGDDVTVVKYVDDGVNKVEDYDDDDDGSGDTDDGFGYIVVVDDGNETEDVGDGDNYTEENTTDEINDTIEINNDTEINDTIEIDNGTEINDTEINDTEINDTEINDTEINDTIEIDNGTEINDTIEIDNGTEINDTIENLNDTDSNCTMDDHLDDIIDESDEPAETSYIPLSADQQTNIISSVELNDGELITISDEYVPKEGLDIINLDSGDGLCEFIEIKNYNCYDMGLGGYYIYVEETQTGIQLPNIEIAACKPLKIYTAHGNNAYDADGDLKRYYLGTNVELYPDEGSVNVYFVEPNFNYAISSESI